MYIVTSSPDFPGTTIQQVAIVLSEEDKIELKRQKVRDQARSQQEADRTATEQHHWDLLEMGPE